MNDFDVVTGPSPGSAAAKIAPVRAKENDEAKRGAAAAPQMPETAREASTPHLTLPLSRVPPSPPLRGGEGRGEVG
jgi:hypothetical protein